MFGIGSHPATQDISQFVSADELQGYMDKMGALRQPEGIRQVILKIEEDFKFQESKTEDTIKQGQMILAASGTFLSIFVVAVSNMWGHVVQNGREIVFGIGMNECLGLLVVLWILAAMTASHLVLRVRKVGRLSAHWLGPLFTEPAHFAKAGDGFKVLSFENLSQAGLVYIMRNKFNQFLQYDQLNKKRMKYLTWAQGLLFLSGLMLAVMVVMFIVQ